MSKKIIASSWSMYQYLKECEFFEDDDYTDMRIENGGLQLPELTDKTFYCESRGDVMEKVNIYKLRRLKDVLSQISDQPLTIVFDSHKIEITGIEI